MDYPMTSHKAVASTLFGLMCTCLTVIGVLLGYSVHELLKTYLVVSTVGHPLVTFIVRNHPK